MSSLVLLAVILSGDPHDRWPGFLGGGANAAHATGIPLTWSPTENIAWKTDLPGHGQSSPVVWNGTVYVTSVEGPLKDTLHVAALRLINGELLWKQSYDSSFKVENSLYVSRAAPTPVADADGLITYFESGDVIALTHSGDLRWKVSLSDMFGKPVNKFGLSASPVQTRDAVTILIDDEGPSYLVSLSKQDGGVRWKTERASRVSWSSPWLTPVGENQQIVCSSAGSVDGYDPDSGKLLWSYTEVGGNTAATPVAFGDGRFLVGASAGREGGTRVELSKKSNIAMAINHESGKFTTKVLWGTEDVTPSFGSPVVYAGHAYWVNRAGVVFCFDAETGEQKYTERTKQSVWAAPVGVGDRVYLFGKDGTTTVLAAGPEFKVLAENVLWDPEEAQPNPNAGANESTPERRQAAAMVSGPTIYGVAIVDGSLLIRHGERMYCLRETKAAGAP